MKYTLLIFSIFASIVIYAAVKYPTGIIGTTKLNGEGCNCHSTDADSTVSVWITGPDTLQVGQSGTYTIHLTGGPKVKGGYNVAALLGSLMAVDTFSQKIDVELTHKLPRQFPVNDTLSWEFKYTAPSSVGTDTIYSVAQSVNGDEIPTDLDKWNFGNNFVVAIVPPVKVEDESVLASIGFELMQNYPNPFNPSTKIGYAIPILGGGKSLSASGGGGFVSLKVYNSLGKEVANLVNEYKPAGSYEVEFQSTVGDHHLASGIYYYKLTVGDYSQTKKMIYIR